MVVLSAIGRFFKKIWDWIKQTAWIQPLLIVGIIFGIIFSIPSIVKGVKNANTKKNSSEVYYLNYQLSLEGDETSQADKLTKAIYANDVDAVKSITKGKTKFFLVIVEENSTKCDELKEAFSIIEKKMTTSNSDDATFKSQDGEDFKLLTIFKDQTTSSTTDEKTAFDIYLDNNEDFFLKAGEAAMETDYFYQNKYGDDSILEGFQAAISSSISAPTIMLVDMDVDAMYTERNYKNGVTEVIFSVEGSTDYERAQSLLDCWNHDGIFKRDN